MDISGRSIFEAAKEALKEVKKSSVFAQEFLQNGNLLSGKSIDNMFDYVRMQMWNTFYKSTKESAKIMDTVSNSCELTHAAGYQSNHTFSNTSPTPNNNNEYSPRTLGFSQDGLPLFVFIRSVLTLISFPHCAAVILSMTTKQKRKKRVERHCALLHKSAIVAALLKRLTQQIKKVQMTCPIVLRLI